MSQTLQATGHLVHYFGFAMAIGGGIAALKAHKTSRTQNAEQNSVTESIAADIVTKLELPGLFIAIFGGILLIVENPAVMDASKIGGPWLHIKLTLVLILLVLVHLKMFRSRKVVRERSGGATESDCNALTDKAVMFGKIGQALYGLIFILATFRYVIFSG